MSNIAGEMDTKPVHDQSQYEQEQNAWEAAAATDVRFFHEQQELHAQSHTAFTGAMEGVDEYLPVSVMTAKERARQRQPKRSRDIAVASSLQTAVAADAACATVRQVVVEQDDSVLMLGQDVGWGKTYTTAEEDPEMKNL